MHRLDGKQLHQYASAKLYVRFGHKAKLVMAAEFCLNDTKRTNLVIVQWVVNYNCR